MERDDFKRHISRRFNTELEDVRDRVLAMGGQVEKQLSDALRALTERDAGLGVSVSEADTRVNAMEVDIDDECIKILAMRQPAAGDLRLLIMVLKTITDLERIGDEAAHVALAAHRIAETGHPRGRLTGLYHLGAHVKGMLHRALNAYARLEVEEAFAVIRDDGEVDDEYEALVRYLMTYMMEDPRHISALLDILLCARALERIGDHIKNVCEQLVYLVEGKDIRHIDLELAEDEVRG